MIKQKTLRTIIPISIALTAVIFLNFGPKIQNRLEISEQKKINEITIQEAQEERTKITPKYAIPKKAYLEVDFICQAPLQTVENWVLHEESCEEAALLQAYLYETKTKMTKEEADKEILNMIKWQEKEIGEHKDLYAEEFSNFIQKYYNLTSDEIKITPHATIEDIKREISNSHPVIVPITGEILKNPHYPYPGYHMLIVTGYTEDRIITNDNGTMHGEGYSYSADIFKKAMDDAEGSIIVLNIDSEDL